MLTFEQYFVLRESVIKTKLKIFDFDGTLVNTPDKDSGSKRHETRTGKPWPHKGWWGRRETLVPPIFNFEPEALNQKIADEFYKAKADPSSHTVLLTGRHSGVKKEVQAILHSYGLEPDEEFYQGQSNLRDHPEYPKTQDTWAYKHHVMTRVLAVRPGIEEIEAWDDREEHMPGWIETAKWIRENYPSIKRVLIHDVIRQKDYKF